MRIGSSIGLIAVGLILAVAVNFDIDGLDLQQIGWILAAVGVVGLVVSLAMARRARSVVVQEAAPPVADQRYPDPRYPDQRDPGPRY